jgi:hypothetical protein
MGGGISAGALLECSETDMGTSLLRSIVRFSILESIGCGFMVKKMDAFKSSRNIESGCAIGKPCGQRPCVITKPRRIRPVLGHKDWELTCVSAVRHQAHAGITQMSAGG